MPMHVTSHIFNCPLLLCGIYEDFSHAIEDFPHIKEWRFSEIGHRCLTSILRHIWETVDEKKRKETRIHVIASERMSYPEVSRTSYQEDCTSSLFPLKVNSPFAIAAICNNVFKVTGALCYIFSRQLLNRQKVTSWSTKMYLPTKIILASSLFPITPTLLWYIARLGQLDHKLYASCDK